jgi:hypothetical protein
MKRAILLLTMLSAVCVAAAQQDFFHRPSPFAGRTLLTLSLFEEVRTELKTAPEINSQEDGLLTKVQGEMQEAFQSANGDFAAMRQTVDKVNAKYDEELIKLLSTDQVKRLKELFVQFNGGSAIAAAAIAKDLVITDEQKAKIKQAQDENQKKVMDLFQSGGGPEDNRKDLEKLQDELKATLEKLLTDDQKTKFKEMHGTKFEFKKVSAGG